MAEKICSLKKSGSSGGSDIDSFENIVKANSGGTKTAYTFTFTVDANEAILIAHENLTSSTTPDYPVVFSSNIEAHKIGPDYTPRMGNYENRFKLYHLKNVTTNSTVTIGQSTSSFMTYYYALFY